MVEAVRGDAGSVVVALQEFVPVGDAFLLAGEHRLVDLRQRLAAVVEQPVGAVARLTFAGVDVAAVVGVAGEHHAPVGVVLGEHVRPGADRVPVERQVLFGHARLAVEAVGVARHRREEGHCQPVHELRVGALEANAVTVAVEAGDAFERIAVEVEPGVGGFGLRRFAQRGAQCLQADDAFGHHAVDRRMQARMCEALDAIDEVVGGQLTRALFGEISQRIDAAQRLAVKVLVAGLAARVEREGRMRLETDARRNGNVVLAVGDLRRRRIVRQTLPAGVEEAHLGHRRGAAGNQRVGALEVVVLQRRLVDLAGEHRLVFGVGLRRIEVLGPLGKRRVKDVGMALARRIRIIQGIIQRTVSPVAAGGEQDEDGHEQEASKQHEAKCNATLLSQLSVDTWIRAAPPDAMRKSSPHAVRPTSAQAPNPL